MRSLTNTGAADIARGLILKATAISDGCDIATATADTFVGISTEIMQVGMTRSVQKSERCPVIVGAAVAVNDWLTTDAQGRAVPTVLAGRSVIGRAVTAQSTVGQPCDCDIQIGRFIVAV